MYQSVGKRLLDLAIAVPALLLLTPYLGIIAMLLRLSPGSPIFGQKRPGLQAKPFTLYKFRTMTDIRDSRNFLLPDSERLTGFGGILRRASLDELPEFFNVIKGDISLVGPRPLLLEYLERYTPEQARRHDVKPGITGWAQVHGRNALSWKEKFELDSWYVDHQSFRLDLKILAITLWKVMKREGIHQPGQATMKKFMGNEKS